VFESGAWRGLFLLFPVALKEKKGSLQKKNIKMAAILRMFGTHGDDRRRGDMMPDLLQDMDVDPEDAAGTSFFLNRRW
jgi:hypothetical protein